MTETISITEITDLLSSDQLTEATQLCHKLVDDQPDNLEAIILMARIYFTSNQYIEALIFLESNLAVEKDSCLISNILIEAWNKEQKHSEIIHLYKHIQKKENLANGSILCVGFAYQRLSDLEKAIEIFTILIENDGDYFEARIFLANAYHSIGKIKDSIEHLHQCIGSDSNYKHQAFFTLSKISTYQFLESEIIEMEISLENDTLSEQDRTLILFALGKAYEDDKKFEQSFSFYKKGNDIKVKDSRYNSELHFKFAQHVTQYFSNVGAEHNEEKTPTDGPIFIVGMPRAGSNNVENILSSQQPMVEALGELPIIGQLIHQLWHKKNVGYPEFITDLSPSEISNCRDQYHNFIQPYRKTQSAFYIDNTPTNFENIGFIKTIFPTALIIDTRCEIRTNTFNLYKEMFFGGYEYSYNINSIQAYYSVYDYFMRQWKLIYPNAVHTLSVEALAKDHKTEINALLDYCGLNQPYQYPENSNNNVTVIANKKVVNSSLTTTSTWQDYAKHFQEIRIDTLD